MLSIPNDDLNMDYYRCSNYPCKKQGSKKCSNCYAIGYCSPECQKEDWQRHKQYQCKLPYSQQNWKPDFKKKDFTFVQNEFTQIERQMFERSDHLYGNTPAHSFLDEKLLNKDKVEMAFVGCGDIRNIMLTINSIPIDYKGEVKIVLNDYNPKIMMRNFSIFFLLMKEKNNAIDTAIHLWYSAFFKEIHFQQIKQVLSPLLSIDPSKWEFKDEYNPNLKLAGNFNDNVRDSLKNSLKTKLEYNSAKKIRYDKLFHKTREDILQRRIYFLQPQYRNPMVFQRITGIVYPMGADISSFKVANTFLFNTETKFWSLSDIGEPLEGWNVVDVFNGEKKTKVPPNDIFGNMFFYLRENMEKMVERLSRLNLKIEMRCDDARSLASKLSEEKRMFDCVETSNLADEEYIGMNNLLKDWSPLVKKGGIIFTYLMNWLDNNDPRLIELTMKSNMMGAFNGMMSGDSSIFWEVQRESDLSFILFDYLKKRNILEVSKKIGLELSKKNSVVPFRDGTKVGEDIKKKPYLHSDLLLKFLSNNCIYFFEWKKL